MADAPASPYPPIGMADAACPASNQGLWALDPLVLQNDWAWQCRYRAENAKVDPANPPRVVFMGDSITEGWIAQDPDFFAHGNLDRGISGQTSAQMLVRFWQDVIALHPGRYESLTPVAHQLPLVLQDNLSRLQRAGPHSYNISRLLKCKP